MTGHAHPSIPSAELYLRAYQIASNDSTMSASCKHTTSIRHITGSSYQPQTKARHLPVDPQGFGGLSIRNIEGETFVRHLLLQKPDLPAISPFHRRLLSLAATSG